MKLRTYHAYTMAEALAAVKRDLGADAVILNTRTFRRSTMLGLRRKTIVEVTATPAQEAKPRGLRGRASAAVESRGPSIKQAAAQRAYGGPVTAATSSIEPATADDRERTRRLALALEAKFDRETKSAREKDEIAPGSLHVADVVDKPQAAARRFVLMPPEEEDVNGRVRLPGVCPKPQPAGGSPVAMEQELAAIRTMVGQVLQRQASRGGPPTPTLPPKLFDQYLHLIAQDISEELADQIVNDVRDALPREALEDESRVRAEVAENLAALIPSAEEPVATESRDGRPLTIALVGPTGVGKTTTLAKLAATFKLRHHKRVGLITSDTYRIAAVDQLRTYANIIGLPLQVALTPAEMRQAVHHLSDCEVILVDTAGRSQNDVLRIDELRRFIEAANPHEVHLVLSSTASEKVLLREAEAFGQVGVHKVVLTKLDEAVSFGMLVNVIRKVGKELSFITTGQEVPDHIEPGRSRRLAELVLGGELRA